MNIIACKTVAAAVLAVFVALDAATAQEPVKPPTGPAPRIQAAPGQPAARLTTAPQGQPKTQEELVKMRDEKLALPVFEKADWTFDYDKARERAKQEGKLIFSYFSRSNAP